MKPGVVIGVALVVALLVAPMAQAATQVRQVHVPIGGSPLDPSMATGTMTLDFVFKNKRGNKRKFTPRQLTRIDFSKVPLDCANGSGEGTSQLLLTMTLNTQIKLTKAPPPHGGKPKPGRYTFRFTYGFQTFTGSLSGTIDKPNHGPRRLRSQGSLEIQDLDFNSGHENCSTRGPKQWGGLPVVRVS